MWRGDVLWLGRILLHAVPRGHRVPLLGPIVERLVRRVLAGHLLARRGWQLHDVPRGLLLRDDECGARRVQHGLLFARRRVELHPVSRGLVQRSQRRRLDELPAVPRGVLRLDGWRGLRLVVLGMPRGHMVARRGRKLLLDVRAVPYWQRVVDYGRDGVPGLPRRLLHSVTGQSLVHAVHRWWVLPEGHGPLNSLRGGLVERYSRRDDGDDVRELRRRNILVRIRPDVGGRLHLVRRGHLVRGGLGDVQHVPRGHRAARDWADACERVRPVPRGHVSAVAGLGRVHPVRRGAAGHGGRRHVGSGRVRALRIRLRERRPWRGELYRVRKRVHVERGADAVRRRAAGLLRQ